jgi:hypothetical protein
VIPDNKGFIAIPRTLVGSKHKPAFKLLIVELYQLASYCDGYTCPRTAETLNTGELCTAVRYLALRTGCPQTTVHRELNKMQSLGVITKVRPSASGSGTVYRLNFFVRKSGTETERKRNGNGTRQPLLTEGLEDNRNGNGTETERKRNNIYNKYIISTTFTPENLANLWNEIAKNRLASVKKLTTSRRKHATARLKEIPDSSDWKKIIAFIVADAFHNGNNERGWKADFDYLLRPDKALRILERLQTRRAKQDEKYL